MTSRMPKAKFAVAVAAVVATLAGAASHAIRDDVRLAGSDSVCDLDAAGSDEGCGLRLLQRRAAARRDDREDRLAGSCTLYGCVGYTPGHACQCNEDCQAHGNCCSDFKDTCVLAGSCARYGCVDNTPEHSCQCNPTCTEHGNCCPDFQQLCVLEPQQSLGGQNHGRSGQTERYLQLVDTFLATQRRQHFAPNSAGLLQTFGPGSIGGGSCGEKFCVLPEPCPFSAAAHHCRFDVYDNAVAAIYLSKRGKLEEARHILDAFLFLLYPDEWVDRVSFGANEHIPSGRYLTLLGASYTEDAVKPGTYTGVNVADGGVDTGNNAWVAMAFAHYAAESGQACYAAVARDILQAMKAVSGCGDQLQGYIGRLPPWAGKYRATEHNVDMYGLGRILDDERVQIEAKRFVTSMYGYDKLYPHAYAMGTQGTTTCDVRTRSAPIAADAQFWNLLAQVDPSAPRAQEMLTFALASVEQGGLRSIDNDSIGPNTGHAGKTLEGIRFSSWGNGAQWENTASAVMAMSFYRQMHGDDIPGVNLTAHINTMRNSIFWLLDEYGSVPASVLGGNINAWRLNDHSRKYPGGSDTGIDWTYLRYPHTAATAWAGLMLLFQGEDGQPMHRDANPFVPPTKRVPPQPGDLKCIPTPAAFAKAQTSAAW